ncbi:MAG: alkylhydroperoxidase, partial [Dethiosulfovibrio peptidovorans]
MLEQFGEKTAGRKLFSFAEIYSISVKAFRSMRPFREAAEKGLVSDRLKERIMLSVTAVNGCEVCSYFHTGQALKAGLDNSEIQQFLAGEFPDVPEDEAAAVLFAQYYADKRGRVDRETWQSLEERYGRERACGILAATRMIM